MSEEKPNQAPEQQPRPVWDTLPRPGCHGVEFRVLLAGDGLVVANLRFARNATIDPHDAAWDIDVICLEGNGYIRIGDTEHPFHAGQTARWPAGVMHCLSTRDSEMETLMVERHGDQRS